MKNALLIPGTATYFFKTFSQTVRKLFQISLVKRALSQSMSTLSHGWSSKSYWLIFCDSGRFRNENQKERKLRIQRSYVYVYWFKECSGVLNVFQSGLKRVTFKGHQLRYHLTASAPLFIPTYFVPSVGAYKINQDVILYRSKFLIALRHFPFSLT